MTREDLHPEVREAIERALASWERSPPSSSSWLIAALETPSIAVPMECRAARSFFRAYKRSGVWLRCTEARAGQTRGWGHAGASVAAQSS